MLDALQTFVDFIFRWWPQRMPTPDQIQHSQLVAHRGCHENGTIENTLPAFEWCVKNKIWGFEFDIHFTLDDVPVVHHDSHCGRLFDREEVVLAQTTFGELRKQIPDIPTLKEVLDLNIKQCHLMIELKTALTPAQNHILDDLLLHLAPKKDYHLIALEQPFLESVTFAPPNSFVPVTILKVNSLLQYAVKNKCAGLAGHFVFISPKRKQLLKENGLQSGVGHISSKNSLMREIHGEHDWIFTDYAESAVRWMWELKEV